MSRQDPKESGPKASENRAEPRTDDTNYVEAANGSPRPEAEAAAKEEGGRIPAEALASALLTQPDSPPRETLGSSDDGPPAVPHPVRNAPESSSGDWSAAQSVKASALSAAPRPQRRFRQNEVLGGKYRLEKSIARGGMGWIFLATQLPLGRKVAVKVVIPQSGDSDFRQRFLLEASTCAKLSHPNIVTIHDYGQTDRGDVFMAMEYLPGRSLARTLTDKKRLNPDRASRIVLQVARALRVAHRAGVVHRDLKPSNVMLLPDSESSGDQDVVKVVDFGLAKIFESAQRAAAVQITQTGVMLGSPRYMSPEQIRNRDVDPRTDIYSLGALYYVMLTGRPPFDGDNATEILAQHLRDPAPALEIGEDDFHKAIGAIVQRCLQKNPDDRYPTIDALLADLARAFQHLMDASGRPVDALTGSLSAVWSTPSTPEAVSTVDRSREEKVSKTTGPASSATFNPARAWWMAAFVLFGVVGVLGWWALTLD
ncbi:MAG: serine/threonine-protein kinase [Myxococcota bacterium]